MTEIVERSTLDLRYEGYRLRDNASEARLLASIAQRGIEEPLQGVDTADGRFLLDGFKRYRCAGKLGIDCIPYVSLGNEETSGIVNLVRASHTRTLETLEQARFVFELLTTHQMSVADIAETLRRSKGWVSMRCSLLEEMGSPIQDILFAGRFPVYSYMYTLRPFRRMNGRQQVEQFVKLLAGKRLSVRDIELLAQGYFRGPQTLRQAIESGKFGWSLEQMKNVPEDHEGCSEFERVLLKDLQTLRRIMQRVATKCNDSRLTSRAFYAQANLLTGGLLAALEPFQERIQAFHDRSGYAQCDLPTSSGGNTAADDQPSVQDQPEHRADDHSAARGNSADSSERQDSDRS